MNKQITISVPGKIHLLGEHIVVYGRPALLTAINLRVTTTISPSSEDQTNEFKKIIEPIVKKKIMIKNIPPYKLTISSEIPLGVGLGSSAAISASYFAALLTFLKIKWDLKLINDLTYEAEKVFHGDPSGGDNSTVVFGGLIWFRKESPDLKFIQPLPFAIPKKLAKNFMLINTGKPKEDTRQMVELVGSRVKGQESRMRKIFDDQEQLVKNLLLTIQNGHEEQLIQTIRAGEKNLESLGVVSPFVKSIIRQIEKVGGVAKICGGGGKIGPTGILLCYHPKPAIIRNIAKSHNLAYFKTTLGVEGLRQE